MKNFYFILLISFSLFSQTPVLEYTFSSEAQGWTANNGSNNFAYNSANGGEIVQTYNTNNASPQLKSPSSLSLDITTLNYLVITVKNSNASNNQIQFVPNMTNSDNGGAPYDSFIGPFTIADNDEYVTLVIDLAVYTGEKFTTNSNTTSRDKWLGIMNSFKIAIKPQNPKVSGTFHISYLAFFTTKPTLSEFNYVGSGYDGLWNRKQNVTIVSSDGNLELTAASNSYAKLTLDENVRIPGSNPHMYVTLVNTTDDNQLRVLGPNVTGALNSDVFLNQTMSGTEEQTLYFNLEAQSSKNGITTTIPKDSDGHYYDIALSFRSTETGFGGKSKGGLYKIKSINFYSDVLSVEDLNLVGKIQIYPNPADSYFVVENAVINDNLEIFNVGGKLIKTHSIHSVNEKIDIEEFNTGIYFVRVNNREALRFIKK